MMLKPNDFFDTFNKDIAEKLLTSILTCTDELFSYGYERRTFDWDNEHNDTNPIFSIDIYDQGDGRPGTFNKTSNIVIAIKMDQLKEFLEFRCIDIFNDEVLIFDNNVWGEVAVATIPLSMSTEIDDGLIFQLQTNNKVMPLTAEHLKILQKIGAALVDDEKR